jgi:predicted dienelactone hydrolase
MKKLLLLFVVSLHAELGVRTFHFQDETRDRPVVVEVWHPTQEKGKVEKVSDSWVHPKEMRNVAFHGIHPLILMSHGNGCERRDMSHLAASLVKKGYIVAAVEHYGNSFSTYNPLTTLQFWERSRDISFAITQLTAVLKDHVDPARIGFVGYSLGGMTGLSLAGAQAENVIEVAKEQQKRHEAIQLDLLHLIDEKVAQQSYKDERIKAFALLSPATFVYPNKTLSAIKAPLALIASVADEVLPFSEHARRLIETGIATKVQILRGAISHFVFLNRVSELGRTLLTGEFNNPLVETHRKVFHKEIATFVEDFFKANL